MVKPYPLKALERLRGKRRDDAVQVVARCASETASRRHAVEAVVTQQQELSAAAEAAAGRERQRAEQQGSRALDWQRLGSHQLAVQTELRRLERRAELERERLSDATRKEHDARKELLAREVDTTTLAGHRRRFEATERARVERAAEDEAQDLHRVRPRR